MDATSLIPAAKHAHNALDVGPGALTKGLQRTHAQPACGKQGRTYILFYKPLKDVYGLTSVKTLCFGNHITAYS